VRRELTIGAPHLTRLPVSLTGDWYPEPHRWRWEGVAQATEPLIGLIFCEQAGLVQWARSDHRASEAGLPMVLHCSARGSRRWIYAGVGRPSGRGFVQGYTTSKHERPVLIMGSEPATGEVFSFATLEGEPTLSLSLLLICRRDVRSRRLGLWGVRSSLLSEVAEPWRTILGFGRSGRIYGLGSIENTCTPTK
jgi:hypothetical protein